MLILVIIISIIMNPYSIDSIDKQGIRVLILSQIDRRGHPLAVADQFCTLCLETSNQLRPTSCELIDGP